MPELPEVETIRLGLEKYIVGKKVLSVEVRLQKILPGDTSKITGARFKSVRRFGKALSLDLDNGYSIIVHVKMTGQLIYVDKVENVEKVDRGLVGALPSKFTHVVFHLDEGNLFYNDIRQFGWIRIIETGNVEGEIFIKTLGRDALKLNLKEFQKIISSKPTKIKQLLMDQKNIAGIGNIYANEALFLAGVHPERKAKSLSLREQSKVFESVLKVLKLGIKYGGSSEATYVNVLGEKGSYQKHTLVYGKTKLLCQNCKTPIQRTTLGGRGTFFCPTCQK